MTGLIRKATLMTLSGLMVAGVAMAGVPSGANSTVPASKCIKVVGRNSAGAVDLVGPLKGTFIVNVKDGAPIPNNVVGSNVLIDFRLCPDIRIAVQADQPAGITVYPGIKSVGAVTDALGNATFTIVGGASNGGNGGGVLFPGSGFLTAKVTADNVFISNLTIAAYDQNFVGGINTVDLGQLIGDTFSPGAGATAAARSDLDCSGAVTSADISPEIAITFTAFVVSASAAAW